MAFYRANVFGSVGVISPQSGNLPVQKEWQTPLPIQRLIIRPEIRKHKKNPIDSLSVGRPPQPFAADPVLWGFRRSEVAHGKCPRLIQMISLEPQLTLGAYISDLMNASVEFE